MSLDGAGKNGREGQVLEEKEISQAVIGRLPRYFRYLGELKAAGAERISSRELSQRMGVTASQIRQDLNRFGGFGQQGYGYNVPFLYDEIGKILGLDVRHRLILIGAGNLGQALVNSMVMEHSGFLIRGIFDRDPALRGRRVRELPVRPMEELERFVREQEIDTAVLTLPETAAEETAQRLVACGIQAIWNFAHVDLRVPPGVAVENVHLSDSLLKLSCNMKRNRSEGREKRGEEKRDL